VSAVQSPVAVSGIRAGSPGDLDAIMECERRPGYDGLVGRSARDEHLAQMAAPDCRYLVLEREGRLAGFLIMRDIGAPDGVLIRRLAVIEQGRGDGRRLMEHALRSAFGEFGARRVWLRVWPHNERGRVLYESLGFRPCGVHEVERDGAPAFMTKMAVEAPSLFSDHGGRA
jgi:ribosomal protein S18 acetylase RimI-like enzyme